MKKITIAIDGFSSTGKSTIARQLADKLGYVYVDSGAMYRAITLFAMRNGHVSDDGLQKQDLIADLNNIELRFVLNSESGIAEMHLNGENVEKQIRSIEVSRLVSKVAEISEIRSKLVQQQKAMGERKGIVMDGRDIGTVVFPDAELKIYMTASAATRAQRRYDELKEKGQEIAYQDVLENVQHRDYIDTHREDSPLVKADDAIEIDNSDLTRDEQLAVVFELAEEAIQS